MLKLRKTKIVFAIALVLIIVAVWYISYYRIIIFKKYNYKIPTDTLIIAEEGDSDPLLMQRILKLAFPEYKLVFSKDEEPHLIIQTPEGRKIQSKWDAPYIYVSGERYGIKRNRRNGPPITELISRTPTRSNQCFIPFIISSKAAGDFTKIRKYKRYVIAW
ncbi:MAG: hypothetical protein HRT87_00525 [Legionellales bacterium]|nr:hypothetical protein [Legionellales bacterium]